jgi:adenosylcobinamide kinase/adenosylcobinamide-phosphate guanylyltransferase
MNKLILVLGGARSGKSSYAVSIAGTTGNIVTYIASAAIDDDEMRRRVDEHKRSRSKEWVTIEANGRIFEALKEAGSTGGTIILDCLTMAISGFMSEDTGDCKLVDSSYEESIRLKVKELIDAICGLKDYVVVVSNEVGLGVVPPYPSGRLFRDMVGIANKELAARAHEVVFMVSGIPVKVK